MTDVEQIPESDCISGAPHPRETRQLFGQAEAETSFLSSFNSDRLHHAWLISGPKGIGKATLAWRIARFLLTTPKSGSDGLFGAEPDPITLDVPPNHPVNARLLAGAEPGLFLLRRSYDEDKKRFRQVITIDEVRQLKSFFGLSHTEAGRRVVIVDATDDLNPNAANALLKILEEPPADALLLLITHQPAKLLPTIRSRCRELRCRPLPPNDVQAALAAAQVPFDANQEALATLSTGSVGEAIQLIQSDGIATYGELVKLVSSFPSLDRTSALKLAESANSRGSEERLDLILRLFDILAHRLSQAGLGTLQGEAAPDEFKILSRLSPSPNAARAWAELHPKISNRARKGLAVNLDPTRLILDMLFAMNEAAGKTAA